MTCWAIVPVKAPGEGKQRLSGALDPGQRDMIVRAMLARVVDAIQSAKGIDRLVLVGPSRLGADPTIPLLAEPGGGLNPAVCAGFSHAAAHGASRVIVLHADLPDLTAQDCEALASPPAGAIAIAPDRHGTGTNGLSLPLPAATGFQFGFGSDSLARHRAETARLGLPVVEINRPGLARDIDEPDDLEGLRGLTG
ncbi:MAG TPA: 2-phospho-L-lactate guanylyltransferase [Novosphingobium sp.]|nr:2-phospho-L-lactate guanylyltransferase [Novosphingobium sp.]